MRRGTISLAVLLALLATAAAVTGFAATLGVESASVDTFSADLAATTTTVGGDTTPPMLQVLEMFDLDLDGKVDELKATFDEPLASYSAGTSPWTLTNVPSGGSLSGVSVSGAVATLAINEGAGAPDTAVGSFTVALAQNAGGIRDAAGNRSSFAATAPADAARPLVKSILIADGGGDDGKPERGDVVTATFSEALGRESICATSTDPDWASGAAPILDNDDAVVVTITNGATAQTADSLTANSTSCVGGLRFGSIDLASPSFVTATRTFGGAGSNRSTVALVENDIVITLGAASGATGNVQGSNFTITYTPHPDLADAAGNKVSGTASLQARHF